MIAIRRLLAQRYFAMLVCAATLALKVVIPTGFMLGNDNGHVTIELCSGMGPMPAAMSMPGMQGSMPDHGKQEHGKPEMPCAFSGLSAATLDAVDPVLLVVLIAFVMAMGLTGSATPLPAQARHTRPPPRAPPVHL